jgi:CDP-diacylglycerol--inositol 3-phosphatidyltransferase
VRSRSWLVRTYYQNRMFMGFCCIACEVLYLSLYLLSFPAFQQPAVSGRLPPAVGAALSAAAQRAAGRDLTAAAPLLAWAAAAAARPVGVPAAALVAAAAVPGFAIKQVCNWVQLQNAMQTLVDLDVKRLR